jgi:hypothetical protein
MCLIVDANAAPLVFTPSPGDDFKPIWDALLARKAVAVYGGQLGREYSQLRRLLRILVELDRQGSLRKIPDEPVDQMTQAVCEEGLCVSNDTHIIALARVSETRLLCSHDQDLHADFTNPRILRPRGSVYQRREHRHLIRRHCGGRTR